MFFIAPLITAAVKIAAAAATASTAEVVVGAAVTVHTVDKILDRK